jgi:tetratricopeptide (TPR) repeat protein
MVLMEENRFAEARAVFEQALVRSRDHGLELTATEVLNNLGWLGLLQGRYDRALDHLERARRSYLELQMPHLAAQAELEMAEAYLELNLAREAAAIAARLAETFAEWGMYAERARAQGCHGRAAVLLGQADEARRLLREARDLYAAEGNALQAAYMGLIEAQLLYAEGYYEAAMAAAQRSEAPLAEARSWGRLLLARWLRGEAARAASRPEAQAVLRATLDDARARELAQAHIMVAYRREYAGGWRSTGVAR